MSPGLFLHVVSAQARTNLSYRVDFWINTLLGFLAEFGVQLFLAIALFAESGSSRIGGFTQADLVIYYVAVLLIAKIVRGPQFSGTISQDIYDGGLTRYLLFPSPYFRFKYAQHLGGLLPLCLQAILFGLTAWLVLDPVDSFRITPLTILGCLVATFAANALYFVIKLPLDLVAFWQDNVWSLAVALRFVSSFLGGAMFPLALFPMWGQRAAEYLPFRLLFDWPVRTLMGDVTPLQFGRDFLLFCVWMLVFSVITRAVWKRGDLQYTGVGI